MAEKDKHIGCEPGNRGDKVPYSMPRLVVYGDIRELTLTAQKAKNTDNKGQDMNMTG